MNARTLIPVTVIGVVFGFAIGGVLSLVNDDIAYRRSAPPPPAATTADARIGHGYEIDRAPAGDAEEHQGGQALPGDRRGRRVALVVDGMASRSPPASAPYAAAFFFALPGERTEADALSMFRRLQAEYPRQLGDRPPIIRVREREKRFTSYGVWVGPFGSADEAGALCKSARTALQAARRVSCAVVPNFIGGVAQGVH